jgi:hypothetical protein
MPKDKKHKKPEPTHAEWWRAAELELEPHEVLEPLFQQIAQDQDSRYAAYKEYARLFGADPDMFGNDDAYAIMKEGELKQNELANTIETLHAQVFKNRIVPAVAANEADYEEWSRARAFSRWLEGILDAAELHFDAMPRAGLDMFIYGTGLIKIGHDEDVDGHCTIRFHRVDPRMFFVDRLEARHGKPRSFYEKDFVDKYKLADEYGCEDKGLYGSAQERLDGILSCKANDDEDMAIGTTLKTNMVTVYEAWHLPTKKGKKDGRHVIWVKGCTLLDEPWSWDRPPFTVMRYGHQLSGFYGKSAVQVLAPTQRNHDKLNAKIDDAQDIMAVPRVILSNGAKLVTDHVDDIPGGILRVDGPVGSITEWNATAVAPELYNERATAPEKMRSLLGVNSFDTQSQLPPQLREVSGPALERLLDAGTARHALVHAEVERATVDLAYMAMQYAADLEEDGKDIVVVAPGQTKTTVEMLTFSEVVVDRKRMKLQVQPMSAMPNTFAGKVEHFGKLFEQKVITAKRYAKMLEVPDDQGATDFLGSDEEIILRNLHFMVKKGKYVPPLQYDNLDLIVPLTTAFINWYRIRPDADMEKVGMLGQYIEDAIALKAGPGKKDPATPAMVDPMTGLPANPMAEPQAPMLDGATGLPVATGPAPVPGGPMPPGGPAMPAGPVPGPLPPGAEGMPMGPMGPM